MSDLAGYLYWSAMLPVGSVQMSKKSVRIIGNFNVINPGCGDERKKFAYKLCFGNMLKNWVISPYFKLKSRFLLPLVGHLLIFE
jgi:hypothetical protein